MTTRTNADVAIVESLNFFDEENNREGKIIAQMLRLADRKSHYSYIRTVDELRAFLKEFGESRYRYLHISCHGNVGEFFTTTEMVSAEEFAGILAPYMKNRRLFLSTCLAGDSKFAESLIPASGCVSILAPAGTIDFDDAAIFWTTFYHLRHKANPDSMKRSEIRETAKICAELIKQPFRFFYEQGGEMRKETFGPEW